MSKPRVFIGSSVEGLDVAYAAQLNLTHVAEVTVWTQGVFNLSKTTMESLNQALDDSDFAVFVFSPDDLAVIRNTTHSTVRDNVLFEFGLFIGRLGRDRVFFLQPSQGELHLPTDLLGVTPGKYDSARADGSLQAATGGACHQVSLLIKKFGLVAGRVSAEDKKEGDISAVQDAVGWEVDFSELKYSEAKSKLEAELSSSVGDAAIDIKIWIEYCDFKIRGDGDIAPFVAFSEKNQNSAKAQSNVSVILRMEGYVDSAIELLERTLTTKTGDVRVILALAECHNVNADIDLVCSLLEGADPENNCEIALALSYYLEDDDRLADALEVIQRCHAKNPGAETLRYRYGRLAQKLDEHHISLFIFDQLTDDFPANLEYWGYLGNTCLQLELYDYALFSYRHAEKLMKVDDASQWIVANIGNLLANRGLVREASGYYERALKYQTRSEYTHERLAQALKIKDENNKVFKKLCTEGRRRARAALVDLLD